MALLEDIIHHCRANIIFLCQFGLDTQLPGGQISPSKKYKNLSHPKLLQILFAMGILMKSQERNWGVPSYLGAMAMSILA